MEQLLRGDNDLYRRLSGLEGARTLPSGASNIETILHDSTDDNDDDDNATIRPAIAANRNTMENVKMSTIISFTFDSVLANSRVYSRFKYLHSNTHSETSLASSTRRTMAISIFSAISLAEISNISVYSLPISIQEIRNLNRNTGVQAPVAPVAPSLPLTRALRFVITRLRESTSKVEKAEPVPLPPILKVPRIQRPTSNRLSGSNWPSEMELELESLSRFPATSSDRPPARHVSLQINHPSRRTESPQSSGPQESRNQPRPELNTRLKRLERIKLIPIYEDEIFTDGEIRFETSKLFTIIDQHVRHCYPAEISNHTRNKISETIVNYISIPHYHGINPL